MLKIWGSKFNSIQLHARSKHSGQLVQLTIFSPPAGDSAVMDLRCSQYTFATHSSGLIRTVQNKLNNNITWQIQTSLDGHFCSSGCNAWHDPPSHANNTEWWAHDTYTPVHTVKRTGCMDRMWELKVILERECTQRWRCILYTHLILC